MIGRAHIARRGFSLLELSVVLGIIALVAGAGMSMASGALKAADRVATQERLNTIKLALDSHAKTYGYLPCPANRALVPADPNFGIENRNNYGAASNTCTIAGAIYTDNNSSTALGAVPVRTLGLPDSYAGDAWGNKFTYSVTRALAADPTRFSTGTTISAVTGSINVYYKASSSYNMPMQRTTRTYTTADSSGYAQLTLSSGTIVAQTIIHLKGTNYKGSYRYTGATSGTPILNVANTAEGGLAYGSGDSGTIEWLTAGSEAAYVVVSHGPNGLGAYPVSNTAVPPAKPCAGGATAADGYNCDDAAGSATNVIFYDAPYNDGASSTDYFDDYIVWGSHASSRPAVNDALYTACPTGVCESWCATCTVNYPGGGGTAPPAGITSNAVLCKKVVTSNASTCSATCFWSGNTATGFVKCP